MKNTFKILTVLALSLITIISCKRDKTCDYDMPQTTGTDCSSIDSINFTTGLNSSGTVVPAGVGVVDPFWRVINRPPLVGCSNPLQSTINGNAYVVNYNSGSSTVWINQLGSTAIAPIDMGNPPAYPFNCNNSMNSAGVYVPYVFEHPFCVNSDTKVDFNFTFKGDDTVRFELVNNITGVVISTSPGYRYTTIPTYPPAGVWSASLLTLPAGSYSIRGYLINTDAAILAYTFKGAMKTSNKDKSISYNAAGCCENNTISIVNIYDENCNKGFDAVDAVAPGWVFTVKQGSTVIRTGTTDINGNIFFSGLPNGTYTVEKTPKPGFTTYNPSTATVTVNNNQVKILEFLHCK